MVDPSDLGVSTSYGLALGCLPCCESSKRAPVAKRLSLLSPFHFLSPPPCSLFRDSLCTSIGAYFSIRDSCSGVQRS